MRDVISSAVTKSANLVDQADAYVQNSAYLQNYNKTVTASRTALNDLANELIALGDRAVFEPFQLAIGELHNDCKDLVSEID
jgi:hypothetical protein